MTEEAKRCKSSCRREPAEIYIYVQRSKVVTQSLDLDNTQQLRLPRLRRTAAKVLNPVSHGFRGIKSLASTHTLNDF